MDKVNRKLDFSSFNTKEKTKKRLRTRNVDKKLNLLSFTKEAKTIDDLEVKISNGGKTTKVDGTSDEFQENVTEIYHPELLVVMPLNQKNLKFATVKYLCPLGYDIKKGPDINGLVFRHASECSNIKFENAECVKKHLLKFHKIARKLQKPHFAPIPRITYKS